MGKTKPKKVHESERVDVFWPFPTGDTAEKTAEMLKFVDLEAGINFYINSLDNPTATNRLTEIIFNEAFLTKLKLIVWEYGQFWMFSKQIATKAEIKATLEAIIEKTKPLFDMLRRLDHMTEYLIQQKAINHFYPGRPFQKTDDQKDALIDNIFLSLLGPMLGNLMVYSNYALETLYEEDIVKIKHFPKIRIARQIANLLLEFGKKPTFYRSGLWAVILGGVLTLMKEASGADQVLNLLREAHKMTTEEYNQIRNIYCLQIGIPTSIV